MVEAQSKVGFHSYQTFSNLVIVSVNLMDTNFIYFLEIVRKESQWPVNMAINILK